MEEENRNKENKNDNNKHPFFLSSDNHRKQFNETPSVEQKEKFVYLIFFKVAFCYQLTQPLPTTTNTKKRERESVRYYYSQH